MTEIMKKLSQRFAKNDVGEREIVRGETGIFFSCFGAFWGRLVSEKILSSEIIGL